MAIFMTIITYAFSLPSLEGFSPFANQTRVFMRSLQIMLRDALSYWSFVRFVHLKSTYRVVSNIMTLTVAQALPLFPPSDTINAQIRELIAGNDAGPNHEDI